MTLTDLIERFRQDADDDIQPFLFSTPWVTERLNEAVDEACIRSRLIHESENQNVCLIPVLANQAVYALNAALYEIDHIAFRRSSDARRCKITIQSTGWLDANVSGWRDLEDEPQFAIQTDKRLRLVPKPNIAGELLLEGYRLPLEVLDGDDDVPEINAAHHRYLVHWALYCAFSNPDVDFYDAKRAATAETEFTRYFGPRPDVDLRRSTREDVPQHVVAFFV
jgi:hypothetical protein